jgi:hypothetical protein
VYARSPALASPSSLGLNALACARVCACLRARSLSMDHGKWALGLGLPMVVLYAFGIPALVPSASRCANCAWSCGVRSLTAVAAFGCAQGYRQLKAHAHELQKPEVRQQLAFLYQGYDLKVAAAARRPCPPTGMNRLGVPVCLCACACRPQNWYFWEMVCVIRKIGLSIIVVFFPWCAGGACCPLPSPPLPPRHTRIGAMRRDARIQAIMAMLLALVALSAHVVAKPFLHWLLDMTEFLSLTSSFLTFWAGQVRPRGRVCMRALIDGRRHAARSSCSPTRSARPARWACPSSSC